MKLTRLFSDFTNSEKLSGILLLGCTLLSLLLANSPISNGYLHVLHAQVFSKPLEFWINDGLMTVFFLLVGLEIERELYVGELASLRRSLLPIIAALGGMLVPAFIYFMFNKGTPTSAGFGIPMATDIAFSLTILSLLGNRVPPAHKVFLTALAIIDDLGAIVVIALFYSKGFSLLYFALALLVLAVLLVLNRLKVRQLWLYLLPGLLLWFFVLRSGIHPTIAGVLLAFTIPFNKQDEISLSHRLQQRLHVPVAFVILPLFALFNTAVALPADAWSSICSVSSYGIIAGLVLGKPAGIFLFSMAGVATGICVLPAGIKKRHLLMAGQLAGIGFTMSVFVALLAFGNSPQANASKIAILIASAMAGALGYAGLRLTLRRQ